MQNCKEDEDIGMLTEIGTLTTAIYIMTGKDNHRSRSYYRDEDRDKRQKLILRENRTYSLKMLETPGCQEAYRETERFKV